MNGWDAPRSGWGSQEEPEAPGGSAEQGYPQGQPTGDFRAARGDDVTIRTGRRGLPGYEQASSYHQDTGYDQGAGYGQAPAYDQGSGYAQDPAYDQGSGYAQDPAYGQQQSYGQQSGYYQQPGYGQGARDAGPRDRGSQRDESGYGTGPHAAPVPDAGGTGSYPRYGSAEGQRPNWPGTDNQQGFGPQQGYRQQDFEPSTLPGSAGHGQQDFGTQPGYAQSGYGSDQPYSGQGHQSGAYPQQGFDQSGYSHDGYGQPGYGQDSYSQDAYAQDAYAQDGYVPPGGQAGYAQDGYVPPGGQAGYAQDGYVPPGGQAGYAQDGYVPPGGQAGYAPDGYGQDGYGQPGYPHDPYGQDAYGQQGFDQQDFDRQDSDRQGQQAHGGDFPPRARRPRSGRRMPAGLGGAKKLMWISVAAAAVLVIVLVAAYLTHEDGSKNAAQGGSTPTTSATGSGTTAGTGTATAYRLTVPSRINTAAKDATATSEFLSQEGSSLGAMMSQMEAQGAGHATKQFAALYDLGSTSDTSSAAFKAAVFVGYEGAFDPQKVISFEQTHLSSTRTVKPGPHGGEMICGYSTSTGSNASECVWATTTTFGTVRFIEGERFAVYPGASKIALTIRDHVEVPAT
jgi:hypothetical protein